jgi:hypothetical protein
MTEQHDIFVRAYAVATDEVDKARKSYRIDLPKWPRYVLVFDTETRITADQSLTFGVFRLCELKNATYKLIREGLFYADDLPAKDRKVLENYKRTAISDAKAFPPDFPLYSRSDFMKKAFWPVSADLKGSQFSRFGCEPESSPMVAGDTNASAAVGDKQS